MYWLEDSGSGKVTFLTAVLFDPRAKEGNHNRPLSGFKCQQHHFFLLESIGSGVEPMSVMTEKCQQSLIYRNTHMCQKALKFIFPILKAPSHMYRKSQVKYSLKHTAAHRVLKGGLLFRFQVDIPSKQNIPSHSLFLEHHFSSTVNSTFHHHCICSVLIGLLGGCTLFPCFCF